jgi:hypothetical protein
MLVSEKKHNIGKHHDRVQYVKENDNIVPVYQFMQNSKDIADE